jgi:N-acylneuraminate cytidylyltransferase
MSSVAIITARGGSKRIPKKNIRLFHGKPIIAYSIEAALKSGCFDEVMVSTDSEEIAEVAKAHGATVPFFRSAETSNDAATSVSVLQEVIATYRERGKNFDLMCMLYPAAPFITVEKLREGQDRLRTNPACDAAFAVVRYGSPIQRAFHIEDSVMSMLWPENILKHSYQLEPTYHDAAQFYWMRVDAFLKSGRVFAEKNAPIIFEADKVHDIDHEEDWVIAELKYALWQKSLQH